MGFKRPCSGRGTQLVLRYQLSCPKVIAESWSGALQAAVQELMSTQADSPFLAEKLQLAGVAESPPSSADKCGHSMSRRKRFMIREATGEEGITHLVRSASLATTIKRCLACAIPRRTARNGAGTALSGEAGMIEVIIDTCMTNRCPWHTPALGRDGVSYRNSAVSVALNLRFNTSSTCGLHCLTASRRCTIHVHVSTILYLLRYLLTDVPPG